MKISKIITTGLSFALIISATGCGAGSSAPASGTASTPEISVSQAAEKELWKPNGIVNLIVPSTAGGGHDTAARVFAKNCERVTGVKFNIVNNGAGGGAVAFAETMNAKPDGMTVGQLGSGLATDQYTVDGCIYTPDSYRHMGIHSGDDCHLIVNANGRFADMDLKDFLEFAKTNPVSLACSGTWGQSDNSRYLLEQTAGVQFQRVGIKGGANCALAVVAGDVDASLVFPSECKAQVDAGNLKILAHLGETRNDFFPEAPTAIEKGYDITLPSFKTLSLPKDTPDDIYEGWCDIFKRTMEDPQTAKEFVEVGVTIKPLVGSDAYDYVMKTHDVIKEIIDSGVTKEQL